MNKKGVKLLGPHAVNLVITVIVIVFLIILIVKVYSIFTDENILNKASDQLEILSESVRKFSQDDSASNTVVEFFPIVEWYLRTFSDGAYPIGMCRDSRFVSCICYCEESSCESGNKVCEGFEFEVGVHIRIENFFDGRLIPGEIIELEEPIYEFNLEKVSRIDYTGISDLKDENGDIIKISIKQ